MKNDIFNKISPNEALEMFEESLEPFLTYLLRQAVSLHLSVSSRNVSVFAHNVKARHHSSNALSTYKLMNVPNPVPNPGLFCDGAETCDAVNDCQLGIDPCDGQACDEDNDICVECGNGICEETYGEHCSNCPQDCPGDGFKGECCGNGICEKFEGKRGTCPEDCG